jgi:DNA processing protein
VSDTRLVVAFFGLHPDRTRALVSRWGSATDLVEAASRGRVDGIDRQAVWGPERCREALAAVRCRAVFLGDDEYPPPLRGIGDPPDVLFVRGLLPAGAGVGIVGTRRCTTYGRRLAAAYGAAVAGLGWVTVSGLARGIDGAAHRGTVDAGGLGVAVLGCGIDVVYPAEHRDLLYALLDLGGAVISEYPPGIRPDAWRFPPRNRVISGLSAAVVVVESGVTGGALVTAARAAEQGREVFATPGDVGRPASVGTNMLIRDGAIPALEPDDLIEALSLVSGLPPPRRPDSSHTDGDDPASAIPATGITVDEFAAATGVGGAELLALLGRLELAGRIHRDGDHIIPSR